MTLIWWLCWCLCVAPLVAEGWTCSPSPVSTAKESKRGARAPHSGGSGLRHSSRRPAQSAPDVLADAFQSSEGQQQEEEDEKSQQNEQQNRAITMGLGRSELNKLLDIEGRGLDDVAILAAEYGNLNDMAGLLVKGFKKDLGATWLPPLLVKVAELSRLQANFRSADKRHEMLIALDLKALGSGDGSKADFGCIVGVVDIDGRALPPDPKTGAVQPQPYVSDLLVAPSHQRRGIASALMRASERVAFEWGFRSLSLQVKEGNKAALALYEARGFKRREGSGSRTTVTAGSATWPAEPQAVLFTKELTRPRSQRGESEGPPNESSGCD